MNVRTLATSGVIAALYVALALAIAPLAYASLQFRIPEIFNHLIVFDKKYFFGIILGVFITNIFSPLGIIDLVFGVGMSVIALVVTILSAKFINGHVKRMIFNTLIFSFFMFFIAWELNIVFKAPFLITWGLVAIGEFVVMAIGIPIMIALNNRINFKKIIQ